MPVSPASGFALVACFALGLVAFGFLDTVRQSPPFHWSFLGSGAVLLLWNVGLFGLAWRSGRTLTLEVALRKQHYVQAGAQAIFLVYWGWYWRPVYDSAFLIVAQLVFAYAFDMLLCWSRRDAYTLGFGPFPVIFSINLFLWFVDDWFFLQFLLVALGFSAKELIRWNKGGRRVHVFNPSSFPLAVFSVGLILTGASDLTWGQDIAVTQFFPPYVYLVLLLVGLPGQYFFGVTSMTMSAVAATYLFGLLYFAATGVYFFYDSYIPIAVFLGMHLLFTDPSTAPRTEDGEDPVRRALRSEHRGVVLAALSRGCADLLRQAATGARNESLDSAAGSSGALEVASGGRSRGVWPLARRTPATSRLHGGLGPDVHPHEHGPGRG